MTSYSERTPLLQAAAAKAKANENYYDHHDRAPGPLELSRSTRYGILLGVWIANFLSALNTTLVATLLSSISSDFNKSHQASWLGTAYLLATCTFTPLYGRLCNVMGRRAANQTAVTFCALGTLACGLSNSMEMLIAARFVAGMGGGGVFTAASIITCDMYDMRARGITQGVAAVFESLGMGLGGPFGGYISERFGWRCAFLFQLPLFALSLILTSINLNYPTPGRGASAKDILKRIDYGGILSLFGAVLSFLVFLTAKFSNEQSWSSPTVITPLVLAYVLFVAFIVIEFNYAAEPVLPPTLLRQKVPMLVGTASFMVSMCNYAIMYNLPTWFQTVMLTSASEAGAHLIPNGVSLSMGSLFAGWMMHRTGRYRALTLICGILPFIATIMIASMKEDSHPLLLWLGIFPLGFGNAVVLQTMLIALLAHLPSSALAEGTGFSQFFRGIGQVGGVGLSSAIFQSALNSDLHKHITGHGAEKIIRKIRQSATFITQLPPDLQLAARNSYASALHIVFVTAACSTFVAYCIRFPVPDKDLDEVPACPPKNIETDESVLSSPSFLNTPLLDNTDESEVDEWESDSDALYVKPYSRRRLSTCKAGVAVDLGAPAEEFSHQQNTHCPSRDNRENV